MADREVPASNEGAPPADAGQPQPASEARELVFGLCHEVGNLVAAVQLEADLLGDDGSPRSLAASAVRIEDLCAQVSGWLRQVRPLLGDSASAHEGVDPLAIAAAVKDQLDWRGSGSATFQVDAAEQLPRLTIDPDSTRDLLLALLVAALEPGRGSRRVELAVRLVGAEVRFRVRDDGAEESVLADWRARAEGSRPLLCAVADGVLRRVGGFVEVSRAEGFTCIELCLPVRR